MKTFGYHGGIQGMIFPGNRQTFKQNVALWNFKMGVNGKILKCEIFWKQAIVRLIVQLSRWKFGVPVLWTAYGELHLFRSYSLSSVWGHSVHFAKFLATDPTAFIQFQPNFMERMVIRRNTGYYFSLTPLCMDILWTTLSWPNPNVTIDIQNKDMEWKTEYN